MPALSVPWLVAELMDDAVAALDRLGKTRGLSDSELAQLALFEALRDEACAVAPASRCLYALNASTELMREALRRYAEPTAGGMSLVELLGMRGAAPADWHRLPLNLDTVLWFGVTRLVDELALICRSPPWSGERHRRHTQISMLRQLQAALGRVIELSSRDVPAAQIKRATDWAGEKFLRVTSAIRDDLPTIRAEAAVLRARRR